MKKYVLKATALAIGALVGGSAVAAVTTGVNFDSSTPTVSKYAKELAYTDANPLANVNAINFSSKLGFGVSNAQTRYIRVDYANATLDAAHAAVAGADIEINNSAAADTYAVVQGGQIGDNYVIYQVTAAADHPASDVVDVKVPALRVTSTASSVNVTYSLHETAVSAVAGSSGTAKLYTKSQDIVTFASGLKFTVDTSPTTTASVEQSFMKFKTGGGYINDTTAKLGSVTLDVDTTVLERDGSAVDIDDLLAATGTKLVLTGDTGIPFGANDTAKKASVYIAADADCAAGTSSTTVPNATGASFTTDLNTYATRGICYVVNGTAPISASTYSVRLDVAAATGTSTASIGDKAIGSIVRDGTELQAPFATIYAGTGNRAVLTSQHSSDAVVTASAITETGVTCNTGTTTFTLKAGKQLFINASEVCPTLSTGTRFALKFIIAAPNNKISGVYNSYTYDAATTKVTDLSSYPLLRPAN
jgi:hypothetical protein